VETIFIGRVESGFCRWEGEDQPAMAPVHGLEPENVAEKCAVHLGVFTVSPARAGLAVRLEIFPRVRVSVSGLKVTQSRLGWTIARADVAHFLLEASQSGRHFREIVGLAA
jgi:hypothetical protein